jgi:hypothetical protein
MSAAQLPASAAPAGSPDLAAPKQLTSISQARKAEPTSRTANSGAVNTRNKTAKAAILCSSLSGAQH